MNKIKSYDKFLAEGANDSLLTRVNRLDQFFMHQCKDKAKQSEFENEAEEILAGASKPYWADAIRDDSFAVENLVNKYEPIAKECGLDESEVDESAVVNYADQMFDEYLDKNPGETEKATSYSYTEAAKKFGISAEKVKQIVKNWIDKK